MKDISEKHAVELSWNKVRSIVSEEIREILGVPVQCRVNVVDGSFWDVTFINCCLPLPKLCQLLQVTQATPEDWEDALPGPWVFTCRDSVYLWLKSDGNPVFM